MLARLNLINPHPLHRGDDRGRWYSARVGQANGLMHARRHQDVQLCGVLFGEVNAIEHEAVSHGALHRYVCRDGMAISRA